MVVRNWIRPILLLTIALVACPQGSVSRGQERSVEPEGESFFFTPPGFEREGKVRFLSPGEGTASIKIVVVDVATGKPTPCRIAVVGPDGHYYQPEKNRLSPYAMTGKWPNQGDWGNRAEKAPWRYLGRYFYSTGESEVLVPSGTVRLEVAKGWEYAPVSRSVTIGAGESTRIDAALRRTAPMSELGYFGGDLHLHFPRTSKQDEDVAFDLLAAEDIAFAALLAYNEPAGPYDGTMSEMDSPQFRGFGPNSIRTRNGVSIVSGQEFRSVHYGHIMYFLQDRIVHEGRKFNLDDELSFGPTSAEVMAAGGVAIMAHGGYSREIYADAALGTLHGVELLQFGIYREIGLADWYHILNSGYRFPAFGSCDFPACRFLGDARTYAWLDRPADAAPSLADWLAAAAKGQSFVSNGPLLLLEVEGRRPGSTINVAEGERLELPIQVRLRCEVTSVRHLDLIVNGVTVKHVEIPADGANQKWYELRYSLPVNESCWVSARAWSTTSGGRPDAESHTNPVYIYVGNRRPYRQSALDEWLKRVDGQIELHSKREIRDKARVLDYFEKARGVLLRIRAQGGFAADVEPLSLLSAVTAADIDPARLDIGEQELREYLKPVPPLSPSEALKSFEVVDGFEMQLVAAEPRVVDPVAAAFDEDGRLYVCEMRDYPFKPAEGREPLGTIRLLTDTDHDGVIDHATVFADKLLWAAGVVPWRGGVFVAASPDIWYLKDTDGDGVADLRRRIFTGFGTGNQQGMVNNLQFGLDHWIYGSTGPNGGMIVRVDDPDFKPIPVSGRDFRFHPESLELEAVTGTVQFGNSFDDWGHRFTCSESQPLEQIVFPDHYLARNPFMAAPAGIHNIAPGPVPVFRISPIERWRQIRSLRRVNSNERPATAAGASHHVVDAAAGVTIYRGGVYPADWYGQAFVGDGQNNLIHRRRLIPKGLTFDSQRVDPNTEVVRSSDIWFRPVNALNAPDGTLFFLDMSREYLETIHVPLDVAKHLDFRSGRANGRIYRLAPRGFRAPAPPRLGSATIDELVAEFESPHGWRRDTAHRLLFERNDRSAVEPLRRMVRASERPQARVHALWALEGMDALDGETLLQGLRDAHPGVLSQAIRLSEPKLNQEPRVLECVARLADHDDPGVRFQAAFSLGEAVGPTAAKALARLARRDESDAWMRAAILSSIANVSADLFEDLLLNPQPAPQSFASTKSGLAFLGQLAQVVAARNRIEEIERSLAALHLYSKTGDESIVDGLLLELGRGRKRVSRRLVPAEFAPPLAAWLNQRFQRAAEMASGSTAAIEFFNCFPLEYAQAVRLKILTADAAEAIQIAVMKASAGDADPQLGERLLELWPQFAPQVARVALDTMLARDDRTMQWLNAALEDRVPAAEVDFVRQEALRTHANAAIRTRAERVFAQAASSSRRAVVEAYRPALARQGRVEPGAVVFEKQCAGCHQVGGKGVQVGPGLTPNAVQDPAALLVHILDPNQSVQPNYVQYLALDSSGVTHTGFLAAQTATSVTLTRQNAESAILLRSEIEDLKSTRRSLMPEGFERSIGHAEMADLIAFLQEMTKKRPGDPYSERDRGTIAGTLIEP